MKVLSIILEGPEPPRTKKNHPQIIPRLKHPVLVPSEQYTAWLKGVVRSGAAIRAQLADAGVSLPIDGPVSIAATVYRDRNVGDWTGFVDAIADALQAPQWKCEECGQKFDLPPGRWQHHHPRGKKVREGLGIISDDRLIQHWDGTRLDKDSKRPRVELEIYILPDGQGNCFRR